MKFHHHSIDEAAEYPSAKVFHHKRRFWRLYREGARTRRAHIETIVRKPEATFGLEFEVGGRGDDDTFSGHLTILGSGLYWGIETGWKLADWLTREKRHEWEGRQLAVRIHDARIWFDVWTHPLNHETGEFADWRHANFHLNPLDALYGEKRYWYEDVESTDLVARMPEGDYPVTATLQRQTLGRPKLKKRMASWTVNVDAPKGVPYCVDHSGGWKGDRVYGFSVKLRERRKNWEVDAQAAIEAWVLQRRADNGFRSPDPIEESQR
jgi:hypothetical protein